MVYFWKVTVKLLMKNRLLSLMGCGDFIIPKVAIFLCDWYKDVGLFFRLNLKSHLYERV